MPFLKIWNDLKLQPGDYSPRKSTTIMSDICLKLTKKTSDAVLVLLLLTFNRCHTLFWCFHCWLWTSEYQLGLKEISWIKSRFVKVLLQSSILIDNYVRNKFLKRYKQNHSDNNSCKIFWKLPDADLVFLLLTLNIFHTFF